MELVVRNTGGSHSHVLVLLLGIRGDQEPWCTTQGRALTLLLRQQLCNASLSLNYHKQQFLMSYLLTVPFT